LSEATKLGMAMTQREAKRFFVDKIVAQALVEDAPLSKSEVCMLSFSESDPDSVVKAMSAGEPESEAAVADYEARMGGLLKRAYKRDLAVDPGAKAVYREAHVVLSEGDHYLLLMTEKALGPANPAGVLGKVGLFMVLVVPGVLAVAIAGVVAWGLFTQGPDAGRQVAEFGPFLLFLAWGGVFMIRLWVREARS